MDGINRDNLLKAVEAHETDRAEYQDAGIAHLPGYDPKRERGLSDTHPDQGHFGNEHISIREANDIAKMFADAGMTRQGAYDYIQNLLYFDESANLNANQRSGLEQVAVYLETTAINELP